MPHTPTSPPAPPQPGEQAAAQTTAPPAPQPAPQPAVPRRAWFALAVLLVGVFMSMLDSTIVNVALPTIRTDLHGGESTLAWVISGYALAFGLALIPAGRIGDRYGHYTIFIVGLAGFTLASLWCGLSRGATELIVARVVQGFFGGVYYPSVIALLQLMFTGKVRAKAFAIQGAVIGFSTALGPIIGGLLIQGFGGWRSIFFVNLPFGVLAVTAALFLLPRTVAGRSVRGVDFGGLAMLAIGLVAILVPLIEAQSVRWAPWTWMSMAGGLAMLACFALWEMRVQAAGRTPIVPPRLFAHKQFTGGVLLAMVYFGAFTSIFFSLSILWQAGLGKSPLASGLVSVPFALGSILGSSQTARLAVKMGRRVLTIGTAMVAVGLVAVWVILWTVPGTHINHWMLLAPLFIAGTGSGLFIAPNQQFIIATVDRSEAGAASGVIGTAQRVGAASGIAIVGSVLFGTLHAGGGAGTTAAQMAAAYERSTAYAIAVSAVLAVTAFLLVFTLPKRTGINP